jgi:hypothetical protein
MKKKKKINKFPSVRITKSWVNSCDHCIHQETEGLYRGHYCNFRSEVMKNMDIKRCGAFEDKLDSNNLKY